MRRLQRHQFSPLVGKVGPPIGGFDLIAQLVRQGLVGNLLGEPAEFA